MTKNEHKNPSVQSKKQAQKLTNLNTRGKNAAGQTNGQFEHNSKSGTGQFGGAGDAPSMKK
ncbi:MAG: hypothetical protein SGI92_30150 [Bryobacteraceae bacterium]|nr:hypothetical protein [Bryobacteraceae bacterium]